MPSRLEQLAHLLEPLVDQPVTQRLLTEASAMRDRAIRAQEATMAVLGLPTAADVERLERRIRGLNDTVADLEEDIARLRKDLPKAGDK